MKPTFIALLALCLCLPLAGAEKEKPLPKDFKSLKALAEKGDARAQYMLNRAYYYGIGVGKDFEMAFKWASRSAAQDYPKGIYALAGCYNDGKGVLRNPEKARSLMEKSLKGLLEGAKSGDAESQTYVAFFYFTGFPVKKDEKKAFQLAMKAAIQGNGKGQEMVGKSLFEGIGTKEDKRAANGWLLKAAIQHNREDAQFYLGLQYERGDGVDKNPKEAANWYTKSANQGNSYAQLNLGILYYTGIGVLKDYVESYKWFLLSSANDGSDKAKNVLESIEKELTLTQRAEGQKLARDWKKKEPTESKPPAKSQGTGFFITEDGYLMTNYHVVENAISAFIKTAKGELPARIIKVDKLNDLAVLKVEGEFTCLPVASSRKVGLGDKVFTIGFPQAGIQGFLPKFTQGSINSLAGLKDDPRQFQVSVPLQPGNSGGALVDEFGNVIGIVTSVLKARAGLSPQLVNYAVKGSYMNSFLESLPKVLTKLKEPNPRKPIKRADNIKSVQQATVIIFVR